MNREIDKLKKLLEHWATHNNSHKESYQKWKKIAQEIGLQSVVDSLEKAIEMLDKSTDFLNKAYDELI
ncbi:MAG: hypothetical protein KGD57_01250 [Candidatus Lokiarchaeota archaeon]|nr:hypothetical protein [Candidatus Lokiarchaeota archaeon]